MHIIAKGKHNIDLYGDGRVSRLEQAILDGQTQKALQLLRADSDINYQDKKGRTPLMAAAEKGTAEICKFLIDHGAKLELTDDSGQTAYLHACRVSNDPKVLEAFEDKGCNIYVRDEYNDTALFLAALYNKNPEIIKHLIAKGFYVNNNDDIFRYTPLMAAAHFTKNPKIMKVLLQTADEYDLVDNDGCTALMHTAFHDNDDPDVFYTVYSFLKRREPNKIKDRLFQKNKEGKNMLAIAYESGNYDVAEAISDEMDKYDAEK